MKAAGLPFAGKPNWVLAAVFALMGHFAVVGVALVTTSDADSPVPVAVMVVELPQGLAAPAVQENALQPQQVPQSLPMMVAPRLDVPRVDAPLPPNPVTLPIPQPIARPNIQRVPALVPQTQSAPSPSAPPTSAAPPGNARGNAGDGPGDSAAAQSAASNWYGLISAHLERNKRYPREARSAGEQGTPSVRFSVDRRGRVSNVSIVSSSGHALLDEATISLLNRVSPLPPMPRTMGRDSVTITLPIEYSLSRK